MIDKNFIFLSGHHRSGTSLLHEILSEHPQISGFSQTGVPENEGQHLQTVFEPAKKYGGPGKYIYNESSHMTEDHPLATEQAAQTILEEWERYYDTKCEYYIEKSPPNLVRTRFFQKCFPNSKFVVILRHPLAVGYATQKWSKTSIKSLIEHTLIGYEVFMRDMEYLNNVYVVRYEDFVENPQDEIEKVYEFLGLNSWPIQHNVRTDVNEKYFTMWQKNRKNFFKKCLFHIDDKLEKRANKIGYSLINYRGSLPSSVFGAHNKAIKSDA